MFFQHFPDKNLFTFFVFVLSFGSLSYLVLFPLLTTLYYLLVQLKVFLHAKLMSNRRVSGKIFVVSGCDSGFGNTLTKRLEKAGGRVFALCLHKANSEQLSRETSSRVTPLVADLRDYESVKRAVEKIQKKVESTNEKIYALVNNAGVFQGTYVELTSSETAKNMIDINYLGSVYLTKLTLPLIAEGGRIINVTSNLAFAALQTFSFYCASKFALKAFNDSLRRELKEFRKITVVSIEPGYHKTKLLDEFLSSTDEDMKNHSAYVVYGEKVARKYWALYDLLFYAKRKVNGGNINTVVDAMFDALFSSFPLRHYIIGFDSMIMWILAFLPDIFVDLFLGILFPKREAKPRGNK